MKGFGEFEFIDSVSKMFAKMPSNGFEGIGDDCAILPIGDDALLFTSDMLNEGVHFLTDWSSPFQVGYKSLMVNISDVAAMGATPVATLLSLALPKDKFGEWSSEFMRGYKSASEKYGVKLVGGDTTASESGISISVTAIGRAPLGNIKRRSAAQVGDVVMVSGELGASAAGLRDLYAGSLNTLNVSKHRMPEAQVLEGEWLGQQDAIHAMCDVSDGVASDLQHILDQSKASAIISEPNVPIAEGATLNDALCGGEDYQLLFTVECDKAEELSRAFESEFGKPLYIIGKIVEPDCDSYDLGFESENGDVCYLSDNWGGYTHF